RGDRVLARGIARTVRAAAADHEAVETGAGREGGRHVDGDGLTGHDGAERADRSGEVRHQGIVAAAPIVVVDGSVTVLVDVVPLEAGTTGAGGVFSGSVTLDPARLAGRGERTAVGGAVGAEERERGARHGGAHRGGVAAQVGEGGYIRVDAGMVVEAVVPARLRARLDEGVGRGRQIERRGGPRGG